MKRGTGDGPSRCRTRLGLVLGGTTDRVVRLLILGVLLQGLVEGVQTSGDTCMKRRVEGERFVVGLRSRTSARLTDGSGQEERSVSFKSHCEGESWVYVYEAGKLVGVLETQVGCEVVPVE